MAISPSGIGSTLDVNSIVSQLMQVEAQPLSALAKKEASYLAKVSAFGSLNGAVSAFQSVLAGLNSSAKFQGVTATSADTTILSGSASSNAVSGSYTVDITRLSQSQTISTAGMASTSATIGDGLKTTLTFQFGTISGGKLDNGVHVNDPDAATPAPAFTQDANQATGSVVIDSTNNSLQGIRDAINKAGIGVTATIVSDGSASPNHLVLTSNKTGETSSMKVSITRDPALPANSALSDLLGYDPAGTQKMTQNSAAQNTALTVNGIAVTSATRTINEAIQGVTLTANKIGSTTVTMARDQAAIKTGVGAFVKAYNDLDKTIKSLTSYDPVTRQGGLLLGDPSVRALQTQVRSMLGAPLTGSGALSSLQQVGITFQKDGSLSLDAAKLQTVVTNNFTDVAGVFSSIGVTTDSLVSFVSSTSATMAGSSPVNITGMASQGKLTAGAAPSSLTIVAGVNDQLAMSVDGRSATVTLAPNTYTQSSLIAQIQSAINGASTLSSAGIKVSVSADASGFLSIISDRYGSASKVTASGTAADALLPSATSVDGADVAGSINGVVGTGSGQNLSGAKGSAVEGLTLAINGGSIGDRGKVNFSQGYAFLLSKTIEGFLGEKGVLKGQTDGLNSSVKDLGKSRDALNLKLTAMEKRYRAQFTALDALLSNMSSTSNFLTQQLTQISNLSNQ